MPTPPLPQNNSSDLLCQQRLAQRITRGNDASEADISVMQKLKFFHEPPGTEELNATVIFINNGDEDALRCDKQGWKSLDAHLA